VPGAPLRGARAGEGAAHVGRLQGCEEGLFDGGASRLHVLDQHGSPHPQVLQGSHLQAPEHHGYATVHQRYTRVHQGPIVRYCVEQHRTGQ